jgi:hypothetical protein
VIEVIEFEEEEEEEVEEAFPFPLPFPFDRVRIRALPTSFLKGEPTCEPICWHGHILLIRSPSM